MARSDLPDATWPPERRARDLLARMDREERIAQLCSVWLVLDPEGEPAPFQGMMAGATAPELVAALRYGIGQITRPFGTRPLAPADGVRALNAFQRRLVEGTRLGIPAIAHEEALAGFMAQGATQFPCPLNSGSTWDPDLVGRIGASIRRQMRAVGVHQALAPVVDVVRDARWGRVEECIGEDPHLVGAIASAWVAGLQGEDLGDGVAATLKHFLGYSASEGGRNFAPAHVGPREVADVFSVPFEMAVRTAGARAVMNAYQEIDGVPCAASRALLTDLLRERWGFEGLVVADYFAVQMLHGLHHVAEGTVEAAAAALHAGLDVELPTGACFANGLAAALDRGLVDGAALDAAVLRVLRLKFELGLFEHPYVDEGPFELETPADRALAREVAVRSIVLLANDGTLPLDPRARVAVIGPNADDPLALLGNYSFPNHVAAHFPGHAVARPPTVVAALRERLGAGRVEYAAGCGLLRGAGDPLRVNPEGMTPAAPAGGGPLLDLDRSGLPAASDAARRADVAVVVVGDRAGHFRTGTVGEGSDAWDLRLPGVQPELVEAVLATGTPTVMVLVNGRPFDLSEIAGRAAAVVEAWFPGQEGAAAIADVLVGAESPGGRTPLTFARGAGTMPRHHDHKPLARGIPPLPAFEPLFAFGHGLSYTRFAYADLAVEPEELPTDGVVTIACTVRNVGPRAGEEVVQLYLRDPVASVTRPVHELRGFRRLALEPGAAVRVRFRAPADLAAFTGPEGVRIVEPGRIEVEVGASSADVRLRGAFVLTGAVRPVAGRRAFLAETAVDPVG
jgi:beta-glucosidase-like glycosyl hydrolase